MRTWLITGATRGFGARIAQEALSRGDAVVATGRRVEAVGEALGSHPNLLGVALDVTREGDAEAAVEQALARFQRIDVLVNNAGYGLLGAVEETSARGRAHLRDQRLRAARGHARGAAGHAPTAQRARVRTERVLDEYEATVGQLRGHVGAMNHAQPGNPAKLASALLALVDAPRPPVRLALGSDTVRAIEEKNAAVASELAAFRTLSLSTDFAPGE